MLALGERHLHRILTRYFSYVDIEDMLRKWFRRFQARRWLPLA